MWAGVALAIALCVSVAVILEIVDELLPQRQQEAFEAIVGVIAVGAVTYMIFFMRRHARELGGDLRTSAAGALAAGSAVSLVVMAFLAVMREGLETAMFLLAAFQASLGVSPLSAGLGAVTGLLIAAIIGWGVYSGGMRINLQRFFRVTSVLLVIIAAGLLSSAVHHANEAALLTAGHQQALDLSAVIVPRSDSVTTGLITGLFGLYPYPSVAEVTVWLLYAVPMLVFVLWPQRRVAVRTPRGEAVSSST
jgi:high-affinity iron transporter